jgi:hypothetical protein
MYMLSMDGQKVDALVLPAMDHSGRVVATPFPGWFDWNLEGATLTASLGSDMLPHTSFRYHYRLNGTSDGPSPFVLVRVERRRIDSSPNREEWQKVWEAADWGVVDGRPPELPRTP